MTTDLILIETKIRGGVWEGILRADPHAGAPQVTVLHNGKPVAGATIASLPERPAHWAVRVQLPLETLSEGVQTFMLQTAAGLGLGHFSVTVGTDRGEDLRAEIAVLRAELDLLKRAFRRHCHETSGQG